MPIFISSTPTTQRDDIKLSKALLKQKDLEDIAVTLPGFEESNHYFTNTGRASLYLILKSLNISESDEVLLQSFTCMALVVPLIWLKIKPVYCDIDPNTYNISLGSIKRRITEKTKAIIVQHTFGIPAQIEEIREYVDEINEGREEKVYLIEDCAHSLNIRVGDKYLGTFGDASFFSFGQEKVISTTQGGCVIVNSEEIENKLSELYKDIPDMPDTIVKYNLRYPLLWDLIKKLYYRPNFLANSKRFSKFTIGKFLIILFRSLGLIRQQASTTDFGNPDEDIYKLSIKQKALLSNQLKKIERFSQHRGKITAKYSRLLGQNLEGSLIRYPVLVDNPTVVKSKLQRIRVIAGNWYNYPVTPRGIDLKKVKYHLGSCPNTEYVIEHIINLPTGINVTERDVERIVKVVEDSLVEV